MSQTHCNLIYHLVFSTKGRKTYLKPDLQSDVHRYLAGAVQGVEHPTEIQCGDNNGIPERKERCADKPRATENNGDTVRAKFLGAWILRGHRRFG